MTNPKFASNIYTVKARVVVNLVVPGRDERHARQNAARRIKEHFESMSHGIALDELLNMVCVIDDEASEGIR